MVRLEPRTYALPYPAVFGAVVAVLREGGAVMLERERGRVHRRRPLHRVTVFVGAEGTTRTTVVLEAGGLLGTRWLLRRLVDDLDRYLGWYYRPAA
jgi:hypothetical protein